ncbi:MAG: DUF2628 domain-containing protein [Candidatus Omnitrophota bacterium]|jgi:hypothetical protein
MKIVDVVVYHLRAKKDDVRFRNLMAEVNQWNSSQIDEFLLKNDLGTFRCETVEEALRLVQAFHEVGVTGAIGGLANPGYYARQFEKFYANGGRFKVTWNWAAAIFNWLWMLFRGLWVKGLLYALIAGTISLLSFSAATRFGNMAVLSLLGFAGGLGTFCFYGMVGNYDYFLKKTKNERLWARFPFQRYKALYGALVLALLLGLLGGYGSQAKNMLAMQRQMVNPKISDGKPMTLSGVEYTAPAGWQMLPSVPTEFGAAKYQTQSTTFMVGMRKQGPAEGPQQSFGPLTLLIFKSKGKVFSSLDQEEVQEVLKPYTQGFDQIPVKFVMKDVESSGPDFLKIAGREWGKMASSMQFRGVPPEAALNTFVYYSIIQDQLVVLSHQGVKTPDGSVEKTLEDFAATLRPSVQATAQPVSPSQAPPE